MSERNYDQTGAAQSAPILYIRPTKGQFYIQKGRKDNGKNTSVSKFSAFVDGFQMRFEEAKDIGGGKTIPAGWSMEVKISMRCPFDSIDGENGAIQMRTDANETFTFVNALLGKKDAGIVFKDGFVMSGVLKDDNARYYLRDGFAYEAPFFTGRFPFDQAEKGFIGVPRYDPVMVNGKHFIDASGKKQYDKKPYIAFMLALGQELCAHYGSSVPSIDLDVASDTFGRPNGSATPATTPSTPPPARPAAAAPSTTVTQDAELTEKVKKATDHFIKLAVVLDDKAKVTEAVGAIAKLLDTQKITDAAQRSQFFAAMNSKLPPTAGFSINESGVVEDNDLPF